ncbi:MAG TPA: hypothetical protein VGO62_00495 [Myxococcota bacterium]|jgi:hypothetical protein
MDELVNLCRMLERAVEDGLHDGVVGIAEFARQRRDIHARVMAVEAALLEQSAEEDDEKYAAIDRIRARLIALAKCDARRRATLSRARELVRAHLAGNAG